MTARQPGGRRRNAADRRQREIGVPPGGSDRRLRAERRDISVARLSPGEWAEAMSNYYYYFHRH